MVRRRDYSRVMCKLQPCIELGRLFKDFYVLRSA
jgi:hypothetical protein